ncbi:protein GAMETE EXPRESSED 3 isoform X2 [Magnolia sinica]|uniref:protein GAMETE EXPRESSED 3 isoform X2 n=1 Tax=Magnolia sinica TaxID=86752 RepID=UPI002658A8C6|nr:protein GAMETE EXPRESSED 3 isoform X2 [Magnolia sinica]
MLFLLKFRTVLDLDILLMEAKWTPFQILLLFVVWIASIICSSNMGPCEAVDGPWIEHQGQDSFKKNTNRFSNPLVGDDGRIYVCYERNVFSFEKNGKVAWTIPLNYTCNTDIDLVHDERGKIYLVADGRILKIKPSNDGISKSTIEIFLDLESSLGGSSEIIGLSISIWSSSLFISIKNRGLFAYTLSGQLLWSTGPVLHRHGYRQGCKENITDCYFDSAPIIDQCEGSLYISNNEGQLYSIFVQSPNFRWVQDFSAIGKLQVITPGNNGRLYLSFPRAGLVMALDVSTGIILWQNNAGPLCIEGCSPVVDSNGWVSVGSMDGFLYSFSPTGVLKKFLMATALNSVVQVSPVLDCSGSAIYVSQTRMEAKTSHMIGEYTCISAMKPLEVIVTLFAPAAGAIYWTGKHPGMGTPFSCRTTRQKLAWSCSQAKPKYLSIYTGNERAILLFLLFQSMVLVALAALVRFCCVFWSKKKLRDQNLGNFLEKRHSLHVRKKAFNKKIMELEQKAGGHESLESLGEIIRDRDRIERKLSTTYSLGRDGPASSLLPLYSGRKTKSYSFQSRTNDSVDTLSDTTTSRESSSSSSSDSNQREVGQQSSDDNESKVPFEVGSIGRPWESQASPASGSRGYANPLFDENLLDGGSSSRSMMHGGDELVMGTRQQGSSGGSVSLKRRKTLSSK